MADEMLTIEQAAELLNRPVTTLRFWRAQHIGPLAFRMGRRLTYLRSDLDEWVREQRQDAAADAASGSDAPHGGSGYDIV